MSIVRHSNANYEEVCLDLGISLDELLQFAADRKKYGDVITKSYSFSEVINDFLKNLDNLVEIDKRSELTYKTYSNFLFRFKDFVDKREKQLTISELNEILLDEFLSNCKPKTNNKISTRTTNLYTSILRKLLDYAYHNSFINKDSKHRFEIIKNGLLPRYFQLEQIQSILACSLQRTYGYRWQTMISFLLATGCRVDEITNLKVKHFDIHNKLLLVKGKGNKERYVPIYDEILKIMQRYFKISKLTNWNREHNGYLFCRDEGNERKKKISIRSLQYQINNILIEADCKYDRNCKSKTKCRSNEACKRKDCESRILTTHSFRHTFAVNCLKAGMKLEYLSQILGHTNPTTTYIYLQMLPTDLRDELMTKYPFPFEKLLNEIMEINGGN